MLVREPNVQPMPQRSRHGCARTRAVILCKAVAGRAEAIKAARWPAIVRLGTARAEPARLAVAIRVLAALVRVGHLRVVVAYRRVEQRRQEARRQGCQEPCQAPRLRRVPHPQAVRR